MNRYHEKEIPLCGVRVPESRLRSFRDPADLAESMDRVGLLHPITVTESGVLVSGWHRLEAARSLGWETIRATVVADDELANRLAEIDENLRRMNLTVYEESNHAEERERVLEAMGVRAKRGDNQHGGGPATVAGPQTTTATIAQEAGMSERSWRNRVKIGRGLGEAARAVLEAADLTEEKHRQFLNSTPQLNLLADISAKRGDEVAAQVARSVLGGEHTNAYDAYTALKGEASRQWGGALADAPSPFLSVEEKAFNRLSRVWVQFYRLDPESVAEAAESPDQARRHAESVERMLDWLTRYRDALKRRHREMGDIRRIK